MQIVRLNGQRPAAAMLCGLFGLMEFEMSVGSAVGASEIKSFFDIVEAGENHVVDVNEKLDIFLKSACCGDYLSAQIIANCLGHPESSVRDHAADLLVRLCISQPKMSGIIAERALFDKREFLKLENDGWPKTAAAVVASRHLVNEGHCEGQSFIECRSIIEQHDWPDQTLGLLHEYNAVPESKKIEMSNRYLTDKEITAYCGQAQEIAKAGIAKEIVQVNKYNASNNVAEGDTSILVAKIKENLEGAKVSDSRRSIVLPVAIPDRQHFVHCVIEKDYVSIFDSYSDLKCDYDLLKNALCGAIPGLDKNNITVFGRSYNEEGLASSCGIYSMLLHQHAAFEKPGTVESFVAKVDSMSKIERNALDFSSRAFLFSLFTVDPCIAEFTAVSG